MDIFEFAKRLDGRSIGCELTRADSKLAEELGFVAVYGGSDDLMEFEGAIHDEVDCYEGGRAFIGSYGLFEECIDDCVYSKEAKEKYRVIKALWCVEDGYSWTYETDIPHATFEIVDDDEPYCRGIVFDLKNLDAKRTLPEPSPTVRSRIDEYKREPTEIIQQIESCEYKCICGPLANNIAWLAAKELLIEGSKRQ
jgi:hypothetical protein